MADVCKFGEECQKRWGITPLQIFLHKDEGHWLSGQPEAGDRESFQVGEKWFKPNYHAHIVFDWMNHDTGKSIKSPIVGTFYSAPSPTKPPFVKVGDKVNEGDTVCIVESMKVMNEIQADISGTVKSIAVKDGEAVEFGQPLIIIE